MSEKDIILEKEEKTNDNYLNEEEKKLLKDLEAKYERKKILNKQAVKKYRQTEKGRESHRLANQKLRQKEKAEKELLKQLKEKSTIKS